VSHGQQHGQPYPQISRPFMTRNILKHIWLCEKEDGTESNNQFHIEGIDGCYCLLILSPVSKS
jgi:hypothetical protein